MSRDPAMVLIVEARFYEDIADSLAAGAMAVLEAAGATVERIGVPGALEVPAAIRFAADAAARGGRLYHGFVALGCVIRGETSHYDIVANESARGLQHLAVEHGLAIGNGILTVETRQQALVRADLGAKDKGGDAARACLAMIALKRRLHPGAE